MSRLCLVTGSASGIGAATVKILQERGWRVIGLDLRNADIAADLSSEEGRCVARAALAARARDGLDAVVACAGVLGRGPDTISVNFFGAVATLRGALPLLKLSAAPRAVAIGSVAAYFPNDIGLVDMLLAEDERAARATVAGQSDVAIYAASKAALTRWCRREAVTPAWAGQGVLLNVVAPGLVETGMNRETFTDPGRRAQIATLMPAPLGRHAQPAEIAELVHFLVSKENSFTTGQIIYSDGGQEALQRA